MKREHLHNLIEFSLNVFIEFAEFSDKNICHYIKTYDPATSCVKDHHATTAPARHMWETGSLNLTQFMLHQFIRFSEIAAVPFRENSIGYIRGCTECSHLLFGQLGCEWTMCSISVELIATRFYYTIFWNPATHESGG